MIRVGSLLSEVDQWRNLNLLPKVADEFGELYEPNASPKISPYGRNDNFVRCHLERSERSFRDSLQ
jgi:hypothetical protein